MHELHTYQVHTHFLEIEIISPSTSRVLKEPASQSLQSEPQGKFLAVGSCNSCRYLIADEKII